MPENWVFMINERLPVRVCTSGACNLQITGRRKATRTQPGVPVGIGLRQSPSGQSRRKRKGPRRAADRLKTLSSLLNVSQHFVQPNNVGSEILAVRALILIRAARLKLVVSAVAIVVVDELYVVGRLREHVIRWPR